jgi:hypothetical protein
MKLLNLELDNNVTLLHSDKKKARHFLYNTIEEYRVGYFLWERTNKEKKFVLDVSWEQNTGDFTLADKSFELKSNRGALSSSALSFEVLNTSTCEPSGLFKSFMDNVDYFCVYLPVYKNYKGKYSHLVNKLLVFNTFKLHSWIKDREEISAKNNNFLHSNALCYKVPVKYIEDCKSFNELIIDQVDIPETELEKISIPKEIYSLFQDE